MQLPTLETRRLRLEPLGPQHVGAYYAYNARNREHLQPWEPLRPETFFTLAGASGEIDRIVDLHRRDEAARFAIFEKGGDVIVGITGLWSIRRGVIHAAIVGYSADVAHQGLGYTTEATAAVVDYAFTSLNLHRIETSYGPTNAPSAKVLRKLGFSVEGYARDYLFINGAWTDAILVSKINDRWRRPSP